MERDKNYLSKHLQFSYQSLAQPWAADKNSFPAETKESIIFALNAAFTVFTFPELIHDLPFSFVASLASSDDLAHLVDYHFPNKTLEERDLEVRVILKRRASREIQDLEVEKEKAQFPDSAILHAHIYELQQFQEDLFRPVDEGTL